MDTHRLRRIIELAGPIVEDWVRQSPAHRALAAEIAAWLTDAAQAEATPHPAAAPRPLATTAPTPPAPATPAAASRGAGIPQDLLDRMIADLAKPPPPTGGLAPASKSAPGVRPPESSPPKPAPPAATVKSPPPDTPERRSAADLAIQKATFHRTQMAKCLSAKDHAAAILHFGRIVSAIDAWVDAGGDAADARARATIAESLAALPSRDVLPREIEQSLDRLSRRMDQAEEDRELLNDGDIRASATNLLRGKIAVLIGGDVREQRRMALEQELGLKELRWIRSTPTNPALKFEADVKRADVDIVLLAIRWVRHATGYAVADACLKSRKPLVRLPGGLGTNSVAAEVLSQAEQALS